jgi:hypothetical protein
MTTGAGKDIRACTRVRWVWVLTNWRSSSFSFSERLLMAEASRLEALMLAVVSSVLLVEVALVLPSKKGNVRWSGRLQIVLVVRRSEGVGDAMLWPVVTFSGGKKIDGFSRFLILSARDHTKTMTATLSTSEVTDQTHILHSSHS